MRFDDWKIREKTLIKRVMVEYPTHLIIEDYETNLDWYPECIRCGKDLTDGSYGDYWLDRDLVTLPCTIIGLYSTDGKVLIYINAEKDWVRDHYWELNVDFGEN